MVILDIGDRTDQFRGVLSKLKSDYDYHYLDLENIEEHIGCLQNSKLIFIVHLMEFGINTKLELLMQKLANLYKINNKLFERSVAGIFISSEEEDYTKQTASMIAYRLNKMGLHFVGRPIVELPKGLKNFLGQSFRQNKTLEEIVEDECIAMVSRMDSIFDNRIHGNRTNVKQKIVAIHSSHQYSNTLALWRMVKLELEKQFVVNEVEIQNEIISDCRACGYESCKSFAMNNDCYYKDIMVESIYPMILDSDIIIFVCPNYNDALSANMTAMINRLTALFRKRKFYDKVMYAIVVSGSSGTEAVASQLIRALNMNKTFQLPPFFLLSEIANDTGAIYKVENIEKKAISFAENISKWNL